MCCGIAAVLNTIAIGYGSLAAVPFGYIVIVVLLWGFLSIPLCVAGTVVGRKYAGAPNNPCRVKRIPSPIPLKAWYLTPAAISAAGGLLPFGSIFIEMYFIFTSFWNYKVPRAGAGWGPLRGQGEVVLWFSTPAPTHVPSTHMHTRTYAYNLCNTHSLSLSLSHTHAHTPNTLTTHTHAPRCTTCTASCCWCSSSL